MPQGMESKPHPCAFMIRSQNSSGDCGWPKVIRDQHVRNSRLSALLSHARETPVGVLCIVTLLAPTFQMMHQLFPARNGAARGFGLRPAYLATGPRSAHSDDLRLEVNVTPLQPEALGDSQTRRSR